MRDISAHVWSAVPPCRRTSSHAPPISSNFVEHKVADPRLSGAPEVGIALSEACKERCAGDIVISDIQTQRVASMNGPGLRDI